ncbi:MAG: PDZ domain-containing protein, partial [Duncaniella sp.]|nr:PDZ domain-containing protein [Duncaniella sp.]
MNNRLKSPAVWMPLAIAVSLVAGMWIGKSFLGDHSRWSARTKLDTILELIDLNYVDEFDTDLLLEYSIPDIIAGLDPHSVYIPAEDLQAVNEDLEGSFSGIGISFNLMGDTINVLEVISGGPSQKVGLMPGDRIVSVDDSIVAGKGISDIKVKGMLRGPKGSTVTLGIKRNSSPELLTYEVTRDDIPVTSIDASYMIEPGVGYIRVNKFGASTYNEFFTEALLLVAQGAEKLVVDLRGNTGGFMEHAVLMANEFLESVLPIVSMRGANTPETPTTGSDGSGSLKGFEVAVLLDEMSASASEIFAGAIQD